MTVQPVFSPSHWPLISSMFHQFLYEDVTGDCVKSPSKVNNIHFSALVHYVSYLTVESYQVGEAWFPLHKFTLVGPSPWALKRVLWSLKSKLCCKDQLPIMCWPAGSIHSSSSLPSHCQYRGDDSWFPWPRPSPPKPCSHSWYALGLPWPYCWCPHGKASGEPSEGWTSLSLLSIMSRLWAPSKQQTSLGSMSGWQVGASTLCLRDSPTTTLHHFSRCCCVSQAQPAQILGCTQILAPPLQLMCWPEPSSWGQSPPDFTVRGSLLCKPKSTNPACSPLGTPEDWGSSSFWGLKEKVHVLLPYQRNQ